MPIRIIGMIGVTPPASDTQLVVIEGALSPDYVIEFAQAHETAGFDMALVGYSSSSAEGFLVAQHAAANTTRLGYLIAHRPGFISPTLMARKAATFDQITRGRLALHIITGKSDAEQQGDGDYSPKTERYERAAEYLALMRKTWTTTEPFDFDGSFYRVTGAASDVPPYQEPHPPLFFGGASEGALTMGAEHCDVYAIYGEPLATTTERITDFRAKAAKFGRTPGFNGSFTPSSPKPKALPGTKPITSSPAWLVQKAGPGRKISAPPSITPASASTTWHSSKTSTTVVYGWALPKQPARLATRHVWLAHLSKSPMRLLNTTRSASQAF